MGLALLIGFCLVMLDVDANVTVNKGTGTYTIDAYGSEFDSEEAQDPQSKKCTFDAFKLLGK